MMSTDRNGIRKTATKSKNMSKRSVTGLAVVAFASTAITTSASSTFVFSSTATKTTPPTTPTVATTTTAPTTAASARRTISKRSAFSANNGFDWDAHYDKRHSSDEIPKGTPPDWYALFGMEKPHTEENTDVSSSTTSSNTAFVPDKPKKSFVPGDLEQMRRNLELKWQLGNSVEECDLEDMHSCGGSCDVCDGLGQTECRFCNGTGFSMLSDGTILQSSQQCLVCSGNGEERCRGCTGSGWVANWSHLKP